MMARATRGLRRTFLSFCRPFAELKMTCSPSKSHHTGVTCGRPSGINVPRLAKARFLNRSRYFSGITCDIRASGFRFQHYSGLAGMQTISTIGTGPMTARLRKRSFLPSEMIVLAVTVIVIVAAPLRAATDAAQKYPPTIVFMTDFGVVDDSVALCRGVMYGIMPSVRIVDLTHQVTPFSILDGARFLYGATPYFPAGTVFVVVIDPGVGSTRKAIVAKSKRGQYFVLPDNGLLTLVEQRDGIEGVHEITNPDWMIGTKLSSTFHGRDIFSPVGAHVARGDDWKKVGPEMAVASLVKLELKAPQLNERGATAEVIATDGPFGNLVTNLDAEDFLKLGYKCGRTSRAGGE